MSSSHRKPLNKNEQKKRVLHLVDHMGLGGAQRLIQGLVTNGYGNAIFALRKKGETIGRLPEEIPVFFGKSSPRIILTLIEIRRVIRELDIQYVHCHLPASVMFGIVLSSLNPSLTLIFHEHGDLAREKWLYKIILSTAEKRGRIIANSKKQKKLCEEIGLKNELFLLYNFINHDEFYVDSEAGDNFRKKLGLSKEKILIGFAGRLIPSKGWEDFLLACQNLRKEDIELIVAGDGKDIDRVRKHIRKHQITNVRLSGQIIDMRAFYNALDIFIMPTKLEASGLSQIEAQACGVPIVVYDTNGLNETVDHSNAIIVKYGAITELRNSIEFLLERPDIQEKMSFAGIANASKFTSKKYIQHLREAG